LLLVKIEYLQGWRIVCRIADEGLLVSQKSCETNRFKLCQIKKCTLNVVRTQCIQDDMLMILSIFVSAPLCTIMHLYFCIALSLLFININ
jgi:hypothetical protein